MSVLPSHFTFDRCISHSLVDSFAGETIIYLPFIDLP